MAGSVIVGPDAVLDGAAAPETDGTIAKRAHYAPPWADLSIIGIAGSSGSGKSTLSQAIVNKLNLPWVVILSIVSPVHGQPRTRDGRFQTYWRLAYYAGLILQEPGPGILQGGVPQ